MIHLLVVGPEIPGHFPQDVEILLAADGDEAVDRLARASRIDAVVVHGASAAEVVAQIREEVPGNLPIAVIGASLPGTRLWERWPDAARLGAALRDLVEA